MSDADRIREMITKLEGELHQVESLDEDTRSALRDALEEIQQALHKGETENLANDSLMDRLNGATQEFEDKHPSLTQTLAHLIDGLGQMGI